MKYISLFSGVGGLESRDFSPIIACEINEHCQKVLERRFPDAQIESDVCSLNPPRADVVAGGWPCQDLSVAGKQSGIRGSRSGLFFEMLRIAKDSFAHTIVAENVPNLLTMEKGTVFEEVLKRIEECGFDFISWRILNSREFGLPHQRRRLFIVASKLRKIVEALHRPLPPNNARRKSKIKSAGFYWTAGLQGICYSDGCVPTLKVGSTLSIPSPPALHFGNVVRKATANECAKLQGFDHKHFEGIPGKHVYSMAGNAVSQPVGMFAMDSCVIKSPKPPQAIQMMPFGAYPKNGMLFQGSLLEAFHEEKNLSSNLSDFIDLKNKESLSVRAATGLLSRLDRSGKSCPTDLKNELQSIVERAIQEEEIAA